MINPFTLYSKVMNIQESVMQPLYSGEGGYISADHKLLLTLTGRRIEEHAEFIHEVCNSKFIAAAFKVVKMLGAAPQLTEEDFTRFTNYVKDGGLEAMFRMLEAEDSFATFSEELTFLPKRVRDNAELMLTKAKVLHMDFVTGYLNKKYPAQPKPVSSMKCLKATDEFIHKLMELSRR